MLEAILQHVSDTGHVLLAELMLMQHPTCFQQFTTDMYYALDPFTLADLWRFEDRVLS